jgi:hypothetical protein
MGAEVRIEDLDKKEYHLHGKMLQGPVRDTVGAQSLAHFSPPTTA